MRLLLAFLLLFTPAVADSLTVDQRPFPGVVSGQSDGMMVELRPLMAALNLEGHRAYGGWCLSREPESDCLSKQLVGPGRVYFEGKPVRAEVDKQGRTLVSLSNLAGLLGLKLEPRAGGMELATQAPPTYAGLPDEPNVANPGAEVALERLLSPGKTSVVVFYLDWCPACWKVVPSLEQLAREHPELHLSEVNIGDWNRPVALQHKVRSTPTVLVFDAAGQPIADLNESLSWLERQFGWKAPTKLRCTGTPGTM